MGGFNLFFSTFGGLLFVSGTTFDCLTLTHYPILDLGRKSQIHASFLAAV
jgi:hypothetical protein